MASLRLKSLKLVKEQSFFLHALPEPLREAPRLAERNHIKTSRASWAVDEKGLSRARSHLTDLCLKHLGR